MDKYVVDAFENNIVVCENQTTGEMENIDDFLVDDDVMEGDVIYFNEDLGLYMIDEEETFVNEEEIENKMDNLWE